MSHFCGGPSHIGGCPGDDGGATVCDDVLYGLVGWRHEDYCTEHYKAHLYVDIAPYHDWIAKVTGGSSKNFVSFSLIVLVVLGQIIRH
jgi:secreted trypsin-like serine protease